MTLVNGVDKLQRLTRGAPVRRSPRPITRKGPGVNKSVTAWYFKVTGCTPIIDEAYLSGKLPFMRK
jgi:hypothetical protein